MSENPSDVQHLVRRAGGGDQQAAAELFARYRERLRGMVRLRLDRRLQGRLDPSDVLQEAYLEMSRAIAEYLRAPGMPFFVWLRLLTGRKLQALHRHHLGTRGRDAGREVSLYRGALPQASSVSLAASRWSGWGTTASCARSAAAAWASSTRPSSCRWTGTSP